MSTNSHSALSNALDVLVNGQQDISSNTVPSAPAVPIDNSNNYIPLFNPAALTIKFVFPGYLVFIQTKLDFC